MIINYKTDQEIDDMKRAGALAYELLDLAASTIQVGISTKEISDIIHDYTLSKKATSAPLGYMGFPEACCTSVNHVVCHGIPSKDHILKEGDIINVDVTPIVNGFHGDTSRTFFVGDDSQVSQTAKNLVRCAKECLDLAISKIHHGCTILDIAKTITKHAHKQGFSVVRDFVGHGIGRTFHEDPNIQHCSTVAKLQPPIPLSKGMCFTIEPMINEGSLHTKILNDGWTAVTIDGKLSAQFEHTIGIRSDKTVDILTLP
ncbi:MAG: type I methionyl aminopeptidase [Proteobacteria bacterium]|nr:type I methionyl aminopeptidase [Pseudomonadota bacterium]